MVATLLALAAIAAPSLPEVDVRVPRRIGGNDVSGEMRMRGYEGCISIDVRGTDRRAHVVTKPIYKREEH